MRFALNQLKFDKIFGYRFLVTRYMKILTMFAVLFVSVILTNAQMTNLSGRIFDHNGAVILGANIHIKSAKEKKIIQKTPDNDGVYSVLLTPGFYSIEVQSGGFKRFEIKKYRIIAADKMCLDIVLEVADTY